MNMIKCASTTDHYDENKEITPTFLWFINSDNVGLAQYELIHQFNEGGFLDVKFESGTTQAHYRGGFLYSDSSLPSNFTVFAFHEQEPNSLNQQKFYLICHLIQKQGYKKSLDKIKASLKQTVHIPNNFTGLRTHLQLFATMSSIFWSKSLCTERLS